MNNPTSAAVLAVALVVFAVALARAFFYFPQTEVVPQDAPALPQDPPARLVIPGLDIDARVQHAGLIAGNRMAAPTNFTDVAWYKYGAAPGAVGSAVIAGHFDNGLGLSGVFKNLSRLKPGDYIEVITKEGERISFRVERLETYPYDRVPKSIFTEADAARLNLITCGGRWIKTKELGWTVDSRTVAYAVRQ